MIAAGLEVKAQVVDSTATAKHMALVEHLSLVNEATARMNCNPALMETAFASSLTQFGITANWQQQSEPFILQKGTGHFLAQVEADSYIRLGNNTAVWGKASYMTGRKRNIMWNSVADYDLLQPDILGDTVGGNTRRERYTFEGGYSTHRGRWHMGGEMLFRAEQEYRKVDPRMRSIVSDLTLRAGAALDIASYMLGLSVQGNIYRQTNSVDFYKPLGSVPEYQLMGLGEVYTRFSGDVNDLIFKGKGVKLQADLKPSRGKGGAIASAWVAQHSYERVARMLNSLPLTTLYNKEAGLRLGWKHNGSMVIAAWGDLQYNRRTSDQHIAGTSSSQIYPVIARMTMYKNKVFNASLTALVGRQGTTSWNVMATGGFNSNHQSFVYPHRHMNCDNAFGKLGGQVISQMSRKWTLTAQIDLGYYGNTGHSMVMPLADMEQHFIDMIDHNYSYLTACYTTADARFRVDYHFPNTRYSLYGEARGGMIVCSNREHQESFSFTIGINI